tara:strand:- start:382 stop:855 length:474 start_codon:yes stop_codon:yes gene_type:complete
MLANNSGIYKLKFGEKESPLLLYSVRCQSEKIFAFLLQNSKVSVNGKDNEGTTPLINACIKNNVRMVKMLLANPKTRVNARTMYGKTGLLNAAQKGYTQVVKLLLDRGANAKLKETSRTKKSCRNRNSFNMARICGHQNIYQKINNKRLSNSLKRKK